METTGIKNLAWGLIVACPLLWVMGCSSKPSSRPANRRMRGETRNYLDLAQQSLERLDEFDADVLSKRVVNDLNRWIEEQPDFEDWQADERLQLLPQSYRDAVVPIHGRLEESTFGYDDFYLIRQAIWSRSIANWVTSRTNSVGFEWLIDRVNAAATGDQRTRIGRDADPLLAALSIAHPNLSQSDVGKLTSALRLFDWTNRNVQLMKLDEFTPVQTVTETITLNDGTTRREQRWSFPAKNGVAGPGYTYEPWESLLYGQGDAWQRARVFIQLARQLDITVVMLAFDETEPANWWRPWLPAVFVGGQLYLMDSDLGIALPSFEGPGIATLQEIVAAPNRIRALDIPTAGQHQDGNAGDDGNQAERVTQFRYPVDEEDLNGVAVLVDASFPFLSKRMLQLERSLVGESRLILSVRPSELAGPLLACKGVKDVRIWTVPLDAKLFAQAREEIAARDVPTRILQVRRQRIYGELNDFMSARHLHFLGRLRAEPQARRLGAIDYYQKANHSQEQIWRLVRHNQQALESMANLGQAESKSDAETPAYAAGEDRSSRNLLEAKWLAIDGLKKALRDQGIEVGEEKLQQIFESQLTLKSMAARYWMALALFELGSFPDSADWLRRMQTEAQAAAWSTGTHYNLARAYEAMGDLQRATRLYDQDTSPQQFGSLVRSRLLKHAAN